MKSFFKMIWAILVGLLVKDTDNTVIVEIPKGKSEEPSHVTDEKTKAMLEQASRRQRQCNHARLMFSQAKKKRTRIKRKVLNRMQKHSRQQNRN